MYTEGNGRWSQSRFADVELICGVWAVWNDFKALFVTTHIRTHITAILIQRGFDDRTAQETSNR